MAYGRNNQDERQRWRYEKAPKRDRAASQSNIKRLCFFCLSRSAWGLDIPPNTLLIKKSTVLTRYHRDRTRQKKLFRNGHFSSTKV